MTVKGIKGWMNRCRELVLPVMAGSVQLLTRQIKSGASLGDMSDTLARDPALATHVFVAANLRNRQADNEILNAHHVMSLLGLQGLIDSLKPLLKLPLEEHNAYHSAYYQAQQNSLLAARIAGHFAEISGLGNRERIQWACLMAGAPHWLLWRAAYPEMRQIDHLCFSRHPLRKKAEMSILGCHTEDLCRMLGREMRLPATAQLALESAQLPSLREWALLLRKDYRRQIEDSPRLKLMLRQPHVLIACCQHLCAQLEHGWHRRKSQRAMRMLAHLCGLDVHTTHQHCRNIALEISRSYAIPDVRPLAASLLNDAQHASVPEPILCITTAPAAEHQPRRLNNQTSAQTAITAKPSPRGAALQHAQAEIPPREINTQLMNKLLEQFSAEVSGFQDIHQILLTCNKALHEGLGMRRAFICVLTKNGDTLRAVYNVGVEAENPLRKLSIPLQENRFFSKLLQKPSSLKVDNYNYAQVRNMLSEEVLGTLANKNFMAMSLFANRKPIGVVYTDASKDEQQISENEYDIFKKICHFTSEAIDHYATTQRK